MSLYRYYILEGDTTTVGGRIQKTSNPLSFKVYGKEKSYLGDDVWCPACQSLGKIIPSGARLNIQINGFQPALNDDLCLCKCNPPPKLIHSQTSFKEMIDDNRLAEYQQLREQYIEQSRLSTVPLKKNFVPESVYDSQ